MALADRADARAGQNAHAVPRIKASLPRCLDANVDFLFAFQGGLRRRRIEVHGKAQTGKQNR
jgi:hypothetical protein